MPMGGNTMDGALLELDKNQMEKLGFRCSHGFVSRSPCGKVAVYTGLTENMMKKYEDKELVELLMK